MEIAAKPLSFKGSEKGADVLDLSLTVRKAEP